MTRQRLRIAGVVAFFGLAVSAAVGEQPTEQQRRPGYADLPGSAGPGCCATTPCGDAIPCPAPPRSPDAAYHLGWAPEPLQITAGVRTWFSWGQADDKIFLLDGSSSEFRFRDVDAIVYELNLDAVVRDQFVAHLDVGYGVIDEGNFVNALSAGLSAPPADIDDDDLFYVTADVGYRLLNGVDPAGRRWIVDLLGGYQYWRETYVPSALGLALFEDRYTWNSFRLGGRAILETPGWRLQGRALMVPWMHFRSQNIDALTGATDYVIEAEGGLGDGIFGVMADLTFSYRVWRELFVEVGYQIFHLESASGSFHQGLTELPFDEAHSTRHGIVVGVNWRF